MEKKKGTAVSLEKPNALEERTMIPSWTKRVVEREMGVGFVRVKRTTFNTGDVNREGVES